MLKLVRLALFVSIVALASACSTAQRARDVNGLEVPVEPYLVIACKELEVERAAIDKEAELVTVEVDAKYRSDKKAELVAWLLFSGAAIFIVGNEEPASRLAKLKGQAAAIEDAQSTNSCFE
ncbi:hypothetical protein N9V47_06925 [Luminiphilus sp.]|nr:hypothetical protein [Luminiphilus sp.]